jgi:hypothetical protein
VWLLRCSVLRGTSMVSTKNIQFQKAAMKRASVNKKNWLLVLFQRSMGIPFLKAIAIEPREYGASSTVNQTAMRGLGTNIIHYSSGGTSI